MCIVGVIEVRRQQELAGERARRERSSALVHAVPNGLMRNENRRAVFSQNHPEDVR